MLVKTPPELWKIEGPVDGDKLRLKKIRNYKSWDITEVSQFCRFGGLHDELVLCAGKGEQLGHRIMN